MLSLTKCQKILNKKGITYTDDEIIIIRNILYKLAGVAVNIINKKSHEITENNKINEL